MTKYFKIFLTICITIFSMWTFAPHVHATQNSFNGFTAADQNNEHNTIPEEYPTYEMIMNGNEYHVRVGKAYFDDISISGNNFLYGVTIHGQTADNGYAVVHENDVRDWIRYYGQTDSSLYADKIIAELDPIEIRTNSGNFETFYNHAQIAQWTGGAPGQFYTQPVAGGYKGRIRDIQPYSVSRGYVRIEPPSEPIVVGQPATFTLETYDASVYVPSARDHQLWSLLIEHNGSQNVLFENQPRYIGSDHEHSEPYEYTFTEAGTYTLIFAIEDVSLHSTETTGQPEYTATTTVTVVPADCTTDPSLPECDGDGGDPGGPGGGSGSCTWTIGSPRAGSRISDSVMDPNATGAIRADGVFDEERGIPTSETLNTRVLAYEYLFQNEFVQMSGTVRYDCEVEVVYRLKWKESVPPTCGEEGCVDNEPKDVSDTETETYTFSFERDYSYWQINNIEAYGINRAQVNNYALPSGTVTLNPSGYSPPTLQTNNSTNVSDHVKPANGPNINPGSIIELELVGGVDQRPTIPTSNDERALLNYADSNTDEPEVRNDSVVFNGSTIMDDGWVTRTGPSPGRIPQPGMIGNNTLYRNNLLISSSLTNRANTPSDGTIYYDLVPGNINGGSNKNFPINGLNVVTVHTPVVTYASTSDEDEWDQRINPTSQNVLVLDRPFDIRIPNNGQHKSLPGYGDRDYTKYIDKKEVKFPFDVYDENMDLIPANTWINVPVSEESWVRFYMPIWVDEGPYTGDNAVYFRTIAENAPSIENGELNANEDLDNHSSYDTEDVYVVGRLYDFRITDISDPVWDDVEDQQYHIGTRNINGNVVPSRDAKYTLPIKAGSHPVYQNAVPKHGYHIKFDLKTKGNMFDRNDGKRITHDGIRITPTFYYVPKSGTNNSHAQPIDLYYHTDDQKFIKIGSDKDKKRLYVTLNARNRSIQYEDKTDVLNNTANYYASSYPEYLEHSIRQTYVGKYTWQILPKQLRTLIGNITPTWTDKDDTSRSLKSIQQWYGQYSLPSQLYAVPKGTNIFGPNEDENYSHLDTHNVKKLPFCTNANQIETSQDCYWEFLSDGYVLVNFKIETLQKGDASNPYLAYYGTPRANQWSIEGFAYDVTDALGNSFRFHDGDVALFDLDRSSSGDVGSGITH